MFGALISLRALLQTALTSWLRDLLTHASIAALSFEKVCRCPVSQKVGDSSSSRSWGEGMNRLCVAADDETGFCKRIAASASHCPFSWIRSIRMVAETDVTWAVAFWPNKNKWRRGNAEQCTSNHACYLFVRYHLIRFRPYFVQPECCQS